MCVILKTGAVLPRQVHRHLKAMAVDAVKVVGTLTTTMARFRSMQATANRQPAAAPSLVAAFAEITLRTRYSRGCHRRKTNGSRLFSVAEARRFLTLLTDVDSHRKCLQISSALGTYAWVEEVFFYMSRFLLTELQS